jgi:hypothetical protein
MQTSLPDIMGYDRDQGWEPQWGSKRDQLDEVPVPGRVWDWANPDLQELVENKSGRLDFGQLALDETALQRGWNATWNINANYPYTANELAAGAARKTVPRTVHCEQNLEEGRRYGHWVTRLCTNAADKGASRSTD